MQRILKIDMHVHSRHSDGMSPVSFLLRKARKKGIGLAITDHNTISGVLEAFSRREKGDIIVPGIEVHSKEGPHLLLYFDALNDLKRFFKSHILPNRNADPFSRTNLSMEEIVMRAAKYSCTIALAHPTARLWANAERAMERNGAKERILKKVHAAETINGQQPKRINKSAFLFKLKHNLSEIGGSDAHSLPEFGKALTIAEAKDAKEFLKKVRSGKSIAVGKENRLYRKAFSQMNIVKTHLSYTGSYLASKIDENGGFAETLQEINYQIYGIRPTVRFIKTKIDSLKARREMKKIVVRF